MHGLRRLAAAGTAADPARVDHGAAADREPGAGDQGACQRYAVDGCVRRAAAQLARPDAEVFYDGRQVAILPMGLCYPGRLPKGGDAPPRPECAQLWRPRLLGLMPALELTLLVGSYAQAGALGRGAMTDRVRAWPRPLPRLLSATASVMADGGLGAAQPVVRGGGAAGAAGRGRAGAGEPCLR